MEEKEIDVTEDMDDEETLASEDPADDDLEVDVDEELGEGSEEDKDEGDEEEDPFASLYEEDEDGEETDDDVTEGPSADESESEEKKDEKYDKLAGRLKETMKKLGYKEDEDPEEMLNRLEAEADGVSAAEYERKKAWERQAQADIDAIHAAFPETAKYKSLKDLPNKMQFARLMDDKQANLTAVQAFSASHPEIVSAHVAGANRAKNLAGTKSHLSSSVPKGAKDTSVSISRSELNEYRDMFPDLSDAEIKKLYKRAMS